jgi:hypothetical protein
LPTFSAPAQSDVTITWPALTFTSVTLQPGPAFFSTDARTEARSPLIASASPFATQAERVVD